MYEREQDFYQKTAETCVGAQRLAWNSAFNQSMRYHILTKDLDLYGKRVMLLGCGEGAGTPFLHARGSRDIHGVDLMPQFIEEAKRRWPEHSWYVVDGTADAFRRVGQVDWVIINGTFNLLTTKEPYSKIQEVLDAKEYIREGFGLTCTMNVPDEPEIVNWSPFHVASMVAKAFPFWKLDHSYTAKDFAVWGYRV